MVLLPTADIARVCVGFFHRRFGGVFFVFFFLQFIYLFSKGFQRKSEIEFIRSVGGTNYNSTAYEQTELWTVGYLPRQCTHLSEHLRTTELEKLYKAIQRQPPGTAIAEHSSLPCSGL